MVAAATLASTAPADAHDLDWSAGAGRENREGVALMREDPAAARARLERQRRELLAPSMADLETLNADVYSPPDLAALSGELARHYRERDRDGLAPGVDGWWDDSVALLTPWGFDPAAIRVPVLVVHGRQDRAVGVQHGEWLASHLPTAEPRLSEHDGHITLYTERVPEVHAWLLERF